LNYPTELHRGRTPGAAMDKYFQLRIAHDASLVKGPRRTNIALLHGHVVSSSVHNGFRKVIVG